MTAARGLALLRIGLGLEFAIWAWAKTQEGWLTDGSTLTELLSSSLARAEPAYAQFLESFVLPHVDVVARLVTIGEWAVAVALTLGLFTRTGSLVGMWLMANFMLMRGLSDVSGSIDRVFFLACFVCLVTSAGHVWGVDALRRRSQRITNTWANPRAAAAATQPLAARPATEMTYEPRRPAGFGGLASPAAGPVFQRVAGR